MSDSEAQFTYDEELLYIGNYHDWFWQGLDVHQIAYLDTPAKVLAPPPAEPIYKNLEFPQVKRWRDKASCRDTDPVVFFGGSGADMKREYMKADAPWRKLCPQCPVRDLCLELARESKSVGIFGGKLFAWKSGYDGQVEYDDETMPRKGRPRSTERSKDWRDRVRNSPAH